MLNSYNNGHLEFNNVFGLPFLSHTVARVVRVNAFERA